MLIIFLSILTLAGKFNWNKKDNIKRYFDIQVPSDCEFVSYQKNGEELKAVVKLNELERIEVLEAVKKHYGKEDDNAAKEMCYFILEQDFGMEKERVIEMYHSFVSVKKMFTTIKSSSRYIFFLKGDNEEYYICFYTYI